jgi:hypothetical protein
MRAFDQLHDARTTNVLLHLTGPPHGISYRDRDRWFHLVLPVPPEAFGPNGVEVWVDFMRFAQWRYQGEVDDRGETLWSESWFEEW